MTKILDFHLVLKNFLMFTIQSISNKYSKKIDRLDLELIIAHAIRKSREFVLAHPECQIPPTCNTKFEKLIRRRINHEPLAYILGEKEFFGLNFKVNKNTLIPRPETELIIDLVLHKIKHGMWNKKNKIIIADIGTGSGNIIISIAKQLKNFEFRILDVDFFGIDISKKALFVSKQNASFHKVDKEIIFLHGNLLEPVKKIPTLKSQFSNLIITANLPYLSPKIYSSCSRNIKKYEPKSALISQEDGLTHYGRLLKQLQDIKQKCSALRVSCFMEISPEQKTKIPKIIKKYFSDSEIIFHKDLSKRWRICQLTIL